jgi:hypothetical protein
MSGNCFRQRWNSSKNKREADQDGSQEAPQPHSASRPELTTPYDAKRSPKDLDLEEATIPCPSTHKVHTLEQQEGPPVVIVRNTGADSPNLTLNVHSQVNRGELYAVAACGIALQFGVLVFSGFATYHPTFRFRWLKEGEPVANYAFPCHTVGTLLLVAGMLACSYIVESSTREERYYPVGKEAYIVWLQRSGTVNDQAFESFAVFPAGAQGVVTTSQRRRAGAGAGAAPAGTTSRTVSPGIREFGVREEVIAVAGAFISLCGFVTQFVGLRGMHWSASIAQLIAIATMVALRAWVRRNLAKLPNSLRLVPGHEIDWLAMTFVGDST